ncbi:protein ALP1-like [Lucilia cuprina]|uniref:protein ALP1-like n=1 Tax=Lucilia cuprina TaxID=7375 RepID=UPI001F058CC8|nr:protein ALP1-like [Lucilia cuprina]
MELQLYENFQYDLHELNIFQEFLNMESIIKRIETSRQFNRLCVSKKMKKRGRRFNPLMDLTESHFRRSYRFSKENMRRLLEMLKDDLEVEQQNGERKERKNQVPIENQIMAAIRYWGGTEHSEITARVHGVSFRTLLKISKRVAEALSFKASRYIRMPCLLLEKEKVTKSFYDLAHMPQVIGAVTHTKVKCKRSNVDNETSTKSDDILHIQIVTDADLKIRDLDCRFQMPAMGYNKLTAADIFAQTRIKERFEQNEFRGRLLLGDDSMKCTSYLYTPVTCAISLAEQAFNNAQRLTYEPARFCLNLWRQRFAILDNELYGSSSTNRHVIVALVLLHNMAIEWRDSSLDEFNKLKPYSCSSTLDTSKTSDDRGRSEFIKNHFYPLLH